MKIIEQQISPDVLRLETTTNGRRYVRRYAGIMPRNARGQFKRYVEKKEAIILERQRQKEINICLKCQIPVQKCKGDCKIKKQF